MRRNKVVTGKCGVGERSGGKKSKQQEASAHLRQVLCKMASLIQPLPMRYRYSYRKGEDAEGLRGEETRIRKW